MKTITTEELGLAFISIIEKLNQEGIGKIEIEDDFYWHFSADEWHKFSSDECTPSLGSLYDDIDELKLLIADPERVTTFVNYDRAAHVLQEISQLLNPIY